MATRNLRSKTASEVNKSATRESRDWAPPAKRSKRTHNTAPSPDTISRPKNDNTVDGSVQAKRSEHTSCESTNDTQPNGHQRDDQNNHSVATLEVIEEVGDIFDAPENSLLIHACNCEGHWGAGIAKAFHDPYPNAYEAYASHCDNYDHSLFHTAQLIPPMDDEKKHFIGCLYTSRSMGRKKDSPTRILDATKPAMIDLLRRVDEWNARCGDQQDRVGEVRMCQINSGLFKVPWAKTKAVLESIDVSEFDVKDIRVVSRE